MEVLLDKYFTRLSEIEPELLSVIKKDYLSAKLDRNSLAEQAQQHLMGRSRFFINTVLRVVSSFVPLGDATVLEIGPGTGSTTAPLAMCTRQVHSYDISKTSSDVARFRCKAMGLDNANITHSRPDDVLAQIRKDHSTAKVDIVVMYAVLEHMTISERVSYLQACWDVLKDGGILLVGDTPNRLVYHHGHTSRLPFFDMVPDELILEFSRDFPNRGFADAIDKLRSDGSSDDDIRGRIDRWGRGVSFHEFLLAIGDLKAKVLAEGLERPFVRAMPVNAAELALMRYLAESHREVPLGFGRASLYLILQKNVENIANKKQWDEDLVRDILAGGHR